MRLKAKAKVITLIAIMLMSVWLYSSTIRIDVTNVYHNQGDIEITIMDQGTFGLSYDQEYPPTVYCCGTQTLYWVEFDLEYPAMIRVTAEQNGRSATVSNIQIDQFPSTTFVYLTLPTIPDFPHKSEM